MLFWICLITGGLFGWVGLKKGFYVLAASLFNLLAGIYVAVLSTPVILSMSPEYNNSGYYAGITMLVLTASVFAVLELFAWFYFLRDAEEYFPKLIDQLGGIATGFAFGYFVVALLLMTICVMPFSKGAIPSFLPQRDKMSVLGTAAVVKACNLIGSYSLECFDGEPEAAAEYLLGLDEVQNTDAKPAPKT